MERALVDDSRDGALPRVLIADLAIILAACLWRLVQIDSLHHLALIVLRHWLNFRNNGFLLADEPIARLVN